MKSLVIAGLLLASSALLGTAAPSDSGAANATIDVAVYDIMSMTREEFVGAGLGTGTSYTAQRAAMQDGSAYLLTAVTATGNGNAITNGKAPTSSSATSAGSAAGGAAAGWRRIGQYVGGASEAEEDEFFGENDRVFEKWVEAQQARNIREAIERRKKAELEKKKRSSASKNGEGREGLSSDESSSDSDEGGTNSNNKKGSGSESSSSNKSGKNNKKVPLALPASQLSSADAKRRKLMTNSNTTIEAKIKALALDVRGTMRRLRSAFIPPAAARYGLTVTGKSAANNDRHRQLMLREFYDGPLPELNASSSSDTNNGEENNDTHAEAVMDAVMYDLLKYTSASATPATAAKGIEGASSAASTSSILATLGLAGPAAAYPRLYRLPIIDAEELVLLADELKFYRTAERSLERQFGAIEKGSYEKDLKLKLAALADKEKAAKKAKTDGDAKSEEGKKDSSSSPSAAAATAAMIEANPRDYYRALRQHTMGPRVTEELKTLEEVLALNLQYQTDLMHASHGPLVGRLLPRLRAKAAALRGEMRSNDESTADLRRQLKEANQLLKLVNNDVKALTSLSIRVNKFKNTPSATAAPSSSSSSSSSSSVSAAIARAQGVLLPASDVTTLLQWVTAERRSPLGVGADSASVHPSDYARITRGDAPLLEGNGDTGDDSGAAADASDSSGDDDPSDNSAAARRSRRNSRRNKRRGSGGVPGTDDSTADGAAEGLSRRPFLEWTDAAAFAFFGLSGAELMTLLFAAFTPTLLEAILDVPSLLVRHTVYVSTVQTRLSRWAYGYKAKASPSALGRVLLFVARVHLVGVSLVTNLHLRFGRVALPLLGLYGCEAMEAYVIGGLQLVRQGVTALTSSSSSTQQPLQSYAQIQLAVRSKVPFTLWVMTTRAQFFALAAALVAAWVVVMALLANPAYNRAARRLARHFKAPAAKKAN